MAQDISITEEAILEKIKEKTGKLKCCGCGGSKIGIAPGFSNIMLQDKIDGSVVSNGQMIPSVYTVCNHCGAMVPYALAVLGILNQN